MTNIKCEVCQPNVVLNKTRHKVGDVVEVPEGILTAFPLALKAVAEDKKTAAKKTAKKEG